MIVGRKRSIVIDTADLLLAVTAASHADPSPAKRAAGLAQGAARLLSR
jgi:hypothetical protein